MKALIYCIHNKKTSGCIENCILLWRPEGCGYTVNLDEAWKVNKKKADEICRSRPTEDFPVSYHLLKSISHRRVDIQSLNDALNRIKV